MKFWQSMSFVDASELVPIARCCEELGFEGVLVSNHLVEPEKFDPAYPYTETGDPGFPPDTQWPEPWTAIAAMASATERLRFATMVFILPLYDAVEVAKCVSTAAALSNGRVALGAGVGWMREEFEMQGVDFRTRGKRYDESIEVLRKLWTGEFVEHHGAHFDFPRLRMLPAPPKPVPILIGGTSDAALRRAARLGDGWVGSGQTPEQLDVILPKLAKLRREAGRANAPFEMIAPLAVPPDAALYRKLEDQGVSGTVSYPFSYALGPRSTLDQKRAHLERFANDVIRKLGQAP
jgi:probable F420-dependent oxidoreductase